MKSKVPKKKVPESTWNNQKKLYALIKDVMHSIQDDYTMDYPTTAKIVAELKRRGYIVTKSDNKRIIAIRQEIKYDIEQPTRYGFT